MSTRLAFPARATEAVFLCLVLTLFALPGRARAEVVLQGRTSGEFLGRCVHSGASLLPTPGTRAAVIAVGRSGLRCRPLSGPELWIPAPAGASAAFGMSSAVVRNPRGDGFDVLAVGDVGALGDSGAVFLYVGGTGFATSAPIVLRGGEGPGTLFGASVGAIGDLNGDGFADLAVGEPAAALGRGSVAIWLGGVDSFSETPNARVDGQAQGERFGAAVAGLGHHDASGFGSLAVGAPGASGGSGQTRVYSGAGFPLLSSSYVVESPFGTKFAGRSRFGQVVVGGGDLNADGFDDLVVTASGALGGRGAALVYLGGVSPSGTSPLRIEGLEQYENLGASALMDTLHAAAAADLVLGAPGADARRGLVAVVFGGATFTPLQSSRVLGPANEAGFGRSLASVHLPGMMAVYGGAPFGDPVSPDAGLVASLPAAAFVEVQGSRAVASSQGHRLEEGYYLPPNAEVELWMDSRQPIAVSQSRVTVDGVAVALEAAVGASSERPDRVSVRMDSRVGARRLKAELVSMDGSSIATLEMGIRVEERFAILTPQLGPLPLHGTANLTFSLTRPATVELELFDVAGRRLYSSGRLPGIAGPNVMLLTEAALREPGVFFYTLRARAGHSSLHCSGRGVMIR